MITELRLGHSEQNESPLLYRRDPFLVLHDAVHTRLRGTATMSLFHGGLFSTELLPACSESVATDPLLVASGSGQTMSRTLPVPSLFVSLTAPLKLDCFRLLWKLWEDRSSNSLSNTRTTSSKDVCRSHPITSVESRVQGRSLSTIRSFPGGD